MLEVQDVHTYFGHSHILHGVSLKVEKGQVIGLLGRNGMGKTTLMRTIMGFTHPRRGKVLFDGHDLTNMRAFKVARLGISLVPQGRQIFPSLNVTENLLVRHQSGGEWNLERIYDLFPPLRDRARHPGDRLSGGEQQMLAIGRSLMTNPTLLLMDEPTEGLSPLFVAAVGEAITIMKERGMSIFLVEQNLPFALKHTDYLHILSKGEIVHSSSPEELEHNDEVKARCLGV